MGQVTTVTIGGVVYSIYGERDPDGGTTQPSAGEYLGGSFRWSATWSALSPDNQARLLVDATRGLDAKNWAGTKTSSVQPLDWPRTGVTYADGTAVDSATVPDEIVYATYILAVMLSEDPELLDQSPAQAANIQRVKAGPAEVEFQRVLSSGTFPSTIEDLVGQFLAGFSLGSVGFAMVTGASDDSAFDETSDFYTVGSIEVA